MESFSKGTSSGVMLLTPLPHRKRCRVDEGHVRWTWSCGRPWVTEGTAELPPAPWLLSGERQPYSVEAPS